MGVLAPRAILLLSAATSLCRAHFQLAKDLPPVLAQARLNPLVLGEPAASSQASPISLASPLSSIGYGLAKNASSEAFAVFHSQSFAGGRGISIITTPERIKQFEHVQPAAYANDFSSPCYEERELPGKGRGLVATKTLHRGDRIFADTPILLVDADVYQDDDDDDDDDEGDSRWARLPRLAVDKLPRSTQKLFWDLHLQPGGDAVTGRIDPNAFELEMGDDTFFGVLPEIARLNHDCRPNAVYFFDAATLTHHVHALTDIAPGTEISITYIGLMQSRSERLARLQAAWHFGCSCSACTQAPELTALSDRRVAEMDRLLDRLRDDDGWEAAPPQMAEALVSLLQQERMHADVHEGLELAALAHCAAGNYWSTVKYAHLAAEASALWDGIANPNVGRMASLAETPEADECWMRGTKWTGRVRGGE